VESDKVAKLNKVQRERLAQIVEDYATACRLRDEGLHEGDMDKYARWWDIAKDLMGELYDDYGIELRGYHIYFDKEAA